MKKLTPFQKFRAAGGDAQGDASIGIRIKKKKPATVAAATASAPAKAKPAKAKAKPAKAAAPALRGPAGGPAPAPRPTYGMDNSPPSGSRSKPAGYGGPGNVGGVRTVVSNTDMSAANRAELSGALKSKLKSTTGPKLVGQYGSSGPVQYVPPLTPPLKRKKKP